MAQIDKARMSIEERASLELHELYRKYGYSRYKMQKFEEYELYLQNRDFIETESIIAFSDASGKLMALKPDLTLSIVKNYKYEENVVQKLFYSENVYRSSKANRTHKEMLQTGLECMGDLDQYQVAEVTMLAAASLAALVESAGLNSGTGSFDGQRQTGQASGDAGIASVSAETAAAGSASAETADAEAGRNDVEAGRAGAAEAGADAAAPAADSVLAVSHMGLISDLLEPVEDVATKDRIIHCIGEKNINEIEKICAEEEIEPMVVDSMKTLIGAYGNYQDVLDELNQLPLGYDGRRAMQELETVFDLIRRTPYRDQVKIDFSIVNDLTYYSGILFQGFIRGIPRSILSGGRYDRLMTRMNKQGGALGFAVYLDYLDMLPNDSRKNDVDVVLLYGSADTPESIAEAAAEITGSGKTVLVERAVPAGIRAGSVERLPGAVQDALRRER